MGEGEGGEEDGLTPRRTVRQLPGCISCAAWALAVVVPVHPATVPQGSKERGNRRSTDSRPTPQLSLMVGCRGNANCGSAKTHAAYRHPYDYEPVR
jgi:hypothetical protein